MMWAIQFWDHGRWDEWAGTRRLFKAETVALADMLNRRTSHAERRDVFGGHRFRVRSVQRRVARFLHVTG